MKKIEMIKELFKPASPEDAAVEKGCCLIMVIGTFVLLCVGCYRSDIDLVKVSGAILVLECIHRFLLG